MRQPQATLLAASFEFPDGSPSAFGMVWTDAAMMVCAGVNTLAE